MSCTRRSCPIRNPSGKAIVVCGPTASGKSDLSDAISDGISDSYGKSATTLVVDSMQVYREIPETTNQGRRRPAEMVGVVSVTEDWTVAHHREMSRWILAHTDIPFVLDAGTGMYLNALLLDMQLSPKVDANTRNRAKILSKGAVNPRRASRDIELDIAGTERRGSIWDGDPIYEMMVLYIRPDREVLDSNIEQRSIHIIQNALPEAGLIYEMLRSGTIINPQVIGAIGIREMLDVISGTLTKREAHTRIATRTRQLARRQMRWFDKLARTISGRAAVEVVTSAKEARTLHTLHDTISA